MGGFEFFALEAAKLDNFLLFMYDERMDYKEIIQQLVDLDWTKQEAQLYVTLLQLGPQPASTVANHLNKNRITIYHALERMVQKRILESSLGRNVYVYSAKSPEILLQQLKDQKNKVLNGLNTEIETLSWLLPQLEQMEVQDAIRPQVQLFHGIEALKNIYQLSLDTEVMYGYYQPWPADQDKALTEIDNWHLQERIKRKIPAKVIVSSTREGIDYANVKIEMRECFVVPKEILPFDDVTIITDSRMLIFSLSELLGISIKSQYIANKQKAIFNLAWEGAKLLGKKRR